MSAGLRCPVCRAEWTDAPQCRRCRADLALLNAVESERRRLLARAGERLREGRPAAALTLAEQAAALRPTVEGSQLAAVAQLLKRNFAAAWHSYQQAQGAASR
ncbi:MAG: hypothetical protein JNM56_31970 [Planctomycetia bacterium]|nr:hypothetical protein [Planctomycetia bacterium]